MNPRLVFLLGLLPLPLLAAVPADFVHLRDLSGPAGDAPRLAEVRLDAAIMAATRTGFPDLCLFDADNREIPRFVAPLYTTKEHRARYSVAARAVLLRELTGNRIEARFDLDPAAPSPNLVEIRTPLRDFIRTVRVSGSEDNQFWQPLAEAEIFDYSRYMDLRRTTVALPSNYCRYFILEIANASEERARPLVQLVRADGTEHERALEILETPFRIASVAFWQEATTRANDEPVLQEWPHPKPDIRRNNEARTTEIVCETRGAPVTRIDIDTPERNFNRLATVQIPAQVKGRATWRSVADGIITRIDLPGLATNKPSVHFAERRVEKLRVVLQNADSPPIKVAGVRIFGPIYRLLWIAEPGATYRLAYGSERLAPPAHDLLAIHTALEQGLAPDLWQLAPAPDATPREASFGLGDFLARPAVFGTLLGLAALALLLLLARALKKAA